MKKKYPVRFGFIWKKSGKIREDLKYSSESWFDLVFERIFGVKGCFG